MCEPIAIYRGKIVDDTFYFAPRVNGRRVYNMILDTGAFELTFNRETADALELPRLREIQIGGVGGTVTAYESVCTIQIRALTYENVPCVIDPTFDSPGLFGLRFFVDNRLTLRLNPVRQTLTLTPAVGYGK